MGYLTGHIGKDTVPVRTLDAMLYVPAGDPRKLAKAGELLTLTTVILDLEDAVAPAAKTAARAEISRLLADLESGPAPDRVGQVWVRINAIYTPHVTADLDVSVRAGIAGLIVPKATAESLAELDRTIGQLETDRGLPPGGVMLMGLIETVAGWHSVRTATSMPSRVYGLSFGAGDFSLELGLEFPPPNGVQGHTLLAAKADLILHSHRLGLSPPHDGVYSAYQDLSGLRTESAQAKAMGFVGKHAIHPAQVPVIREAFAATEAELERARRILRAAEEAEEKGLGNAAANGALVDAPVVERARRLLDRQPSGTGRALV